MCLFGADRNVAAGEGVELALFDRAIIVVFVTIPGVGKTFLCEKLLETLDRKVFEVLHCHGDAMAAGAAVEGSSGRAARTVKKGGGYWAAVADAAATRRGDGRTTIVLADKNLIDSPLGNPHSSFLMSCSKACMVAR